MSALRKIHLQRNRWNSVWPSERTVSSTVERCLPYSGVSLERVVSSAWPLFPPPGWKTTFYHTWPLYRFTIYPQFTSIHNHLVYSQCKEKYRVQELNTFLVRAQSQTVWSACYCITGQTLGHVFHKKVHSLLEGVYYGMEWSHRGLD